MNSFIQRSNAPDDHMMWQRFIAGEVAAFNDLMSSQFRSLFHYGSKFSRDREFVKDSIQDLFLLLWERRERLRDDVILKPYLMASLRRLMHRKSDLKARIEMEEFKGQEAPFELQFSVEQHYIEEESTLLLAENLKKLLNDLPPRQKEVVYLKYYQELDRSQIAEIMEVSPQTVSNLLQIALKHLKTHWRAEFLTFFLLHFLV